MLRISSSGLERRNVLDHKGMDERQFLDPLFRILQNKETGAEKLIKNKVISGGMSPKVSAGIFCVNNGVESAQIINGTDPHSVIAELFTDKGIGTQIFL